ncbi:uncharacterized protein EI90DRAFT_2970660 [Cantharellus anzutake]|uniref:uncharacterized protein n=1 Tax=Cantharellus anzutake TaxID=1750568 RepID=UPI001906EC7E|nr:uncharacterized protein EI90DRAFT_2970660 [Cantharellus anzutake]KAF8334247.1 hypothetical protein EI90DRAFT_2970660 [Cantharellus anzutake]
MGEHRLADLFSSLRRVIPRVPFFQLAVHRVPTRWTLYRGLLRNAPGENSKWRLRAFFRRYQHLTSPPTTKKKLEQAHSLLDAFIDAKNGDETAMNLARRFESNSRVSRVREAWNLTYARELAFIQKMRRRPHLTGGYLRPSFYNRPLPRMRNQPVDVTMMISKRVKARARRQVAFESIQSTKEDVRLECSFEGRLKAEAARLGFESSWEPYFGDLRGWLEPLRQHEKSLQASFELDTERASSKFSPELLERIKDARRNLINNKTRERERERRGEVLMATLRRMRQGPPPHVLTRMSEKDKREDKILREVGAGGYSKWVQSGVWGEGDLGKERNHEKLDRLEHQIREHNLRKRATGKY